MFQNKMSNQEIHQEPKQEPNQETATPKVTSIEKNTKVGTKPTDPGRVAAGKKKLAELNKKKDKRRKYPLN